MKTLPNLAYVIGGSIPNTELKFIQDFNDTKKIPDGSIVLNTIDLCFTALNNVPQGGINPQEMFNRLQVLTSIDQQKKAGCDNLELEDSHASTLKNCVLQLNFASVNIAFNHFVDQIKNYC